MPKTQNSKTISLLICLFVYMVALFAAWYSTIFFKDDFNLLIVALLADVVATVVVFVFSVIFKNSSLYDPYWSVAPPVIIWFWMCQMQAEFSGTTILLLAVTTLWSIRLTLNWIRGWQGLKHEDWRYIQLRNENPRLYPVVNLGGIHLFPTAMVFICLIPAYYSIMKADAQINFTISAGALLCVFATVISLVADEQMRKFRKHSKASAIMESGLWKHSRHPNYLGEILFWLGVWVIAVGVDIHLYWTVFGFIALTLMFVFISIPMMEKRSLSKRENYADVQKRVPMLIKWF